MLRLWLQIFLVLTIKGIARGTGAQGGDEETCNAYIPGSDLTYNIKDECDLGYVYWERPNAGENVLTMTIDRDQAINLCLMSDIIENPSRKVIDLTHNNKVLSFSGDRVCVASSDGKLKLKLTLKDELNSEIPNLSFADTLQYAVTNP